MKTKYSKPIHNIESYMLRKKYASSTIKQYIHQIENVIDFSDSDVYHITANDFNNYIDEQLSINNISSSFINQVISAGILFLKHGLGKTDQSIRPLNRPRSDRKLPTILSIGQVYDMINASNNLKHQCIIEIAFTHGLRRHEIINLTIFDIDSANMQITIKNSKGAKDRNIPLNKDCLIRLRKYWKKHKPTQYLFEGQFGGKYSATSITNIIKDNAELIGIRKKVSPHSLRHSFGSHLVKLGVNLRVIQEWLGHASSKTTEIYTHVTSDFENPIKNIA